MPFADGTSHTYNLHCSNCFQIRTLWPDIRNSKMPQGWRKWEEQVGTDFPRGWRSDLRGPQLPQAPKMQPVRGRFDRLLLLPGPGVHSDAGYATQLTRDTTVYETSSQSVFQAHRVSTVSYYQNTNGENYRMLPLKVITHFSTFFMLKPPMCKIKQWGNIESRKIKDLSYLDSAPLS